MTLRVGINGLGRVGRAFLRIATDRGLEVVAVNDIADVKTLAHLLRFDSTYGPIDAAVAAGPDSLMLDGRTIAVTAHRDPAGIPWHDFGADVVIEATGKFRARDDAMAHLKGGARKVLISAPGKGVDATIVMGVNDRDYDPASHDIVSVASCTTNCVAPMVKVLDDSFGLVKGFMTTIHAYTGDQALLDAPHKDLRRARSAAANIVPTTTGAARTVGEVLPRLRGRLDGVAVRVPVEDGSLTDLAAIVSRPTTADEINAAFERAANGELAGVLRHCTDPIVSRDIVGDSASCVFDSLLTQADAELVKIFGWYDNEWGYANRLADVAELVISS
jgi:glyceraldehyde 3-phosphate dehydrogenase (phosphorylating)